MNCRNGFHRTNINLEIINVGGGFGIDYENPDKESAL